MSKRHIVLVLVTVGLLAAAGLMMGQTATPSDIPDGARTPRPPAAVPEPATIVMVGTGLFGYGAYFLRSRFRGSRRD